MRFRAATAVTCLAVAFVSVHTRSVGTSDNNVTKRETRDDPFPDWVPFKNKHGEELGEFLQVETVTKKTKKRLALPINFVLKSVADAEADDYYEKGLESDGEEYFEKREWTDASRAGKADSRQPIKHTELSDIEGVLGIITKNNAVHKPQTKDEKPTTKDEEPMTKDEEPVTKKKEPTTKDEDLTSEDEEPTTKDDDPSTQKPAPKQNEDYSEEEEDAEKRKSELTSEERAENEKKKAFILDSVDKLKARHEMEQKLLTERIKEEAMYKEERDRDEVATDPYDKYNHRSKVKSEDYDEYDSKYEDKYRLTPLKRHTSPTSTSTITSSPSTETTSARTVLTGRMSVFRHPNIYMVYDEESTTEPTKTSFESTSSEKKSDNPKLHYETTTPLAKFNSNINERISLVPQDNELREGEPTLFFPKKTKRKNPQRPYEKDFDSQVSASSQDKAKNELSKSADAVWAGSETAPSGTGTGSDLTAPSGGNDSNDFQAAETLKGEEAQTSKEVSRSGETAASAPAELAETPALSGDAVSASTDHKEEHKGDHNHKHEQGGEQEHHSEHSSERSESGKKAYKGHHEDKKTAKGHHDKEDHLGKYHDHGGSNKEHHDEDKHYGEHHHEEHGKKHAEYEESGKHSKGHSTKGSHDIHKKEEYEKNVEFFEEEGDSAEEDKKGGHHEEIGHKKGGKFGKSQHDSGHHHGAKGDSGHFDKGGHLALHKGHSAAAGHNSHGKHVASKFVEGGKKGGKKWIYHHGFPAKNANLVVIDRRGDQLYHGPQYYG